MWIWSKQLGWCGDGGGHIAFLPTTITYHTHHLSPTPQPHPHLRPCLQLQPLSAFPIRMIRLAPSCPLLLTCSHRYYSLLLSLGLLPKGLRPLGTPKHRGWNGEDGVAGHPSAALRDPAGWPAPAGAPPAGTACCSSATDNRNGIIEMKGMVGGGGTPRTADAMFGRALWQLPRNSICTIPTAVIGGPKGAKPLWQQPQR